GLELPEDLLDLRRQRQLERKPARRQRHLARFFRVLRLWTEKLRQSRFDTLDAKGCKGECRRAHGRFRLASGLHEEHVECFGIARALEGLDPAFAYGAIGTEQHP